MTLEELLAQINEYFFLKEFSFAKNQFSPKPGSEVEFADHVIWISDRLFLFQMKQRAAVLGATPDEERKWFEKKVIKKATKQVRDTLSYLKSATDIAITNQRGHTFNVGRCSSKPVSIVLHLANNGLPEDCWQKKHHISREAGFIHIIPAHDYCPAHSQCG